MGTTTRSASYTTERIVSEIAGGVSRNTAVTPESCHCLSSVGSSRGCADLEQLGFSRRSRPSIVTFQRAIFPQALLFQEAWSSVREALLNQEPPPTAGGHSQGLRLRLPLSKSPCYLPKSPLTPQHQLIRFVSHPTHDVLD